MKTTELLPVKVYSYAITRKENALMVHSMGLCINLAEYSHISTSQTLTSKRALLYQRTYTEKKPSQTD